MNKTLFLSRSAAIAALYVALTFVSYALGLSSGAVQLRLSEALYVLCCFMPEAVPGLFVGCFLANLLTGCALLDVIFGSLATLAGALGAYFLAKHRFLAVIPPILANTAVIPAVLFFVYKAEGSYLYFTLTVFLGELISCGIFGQICYSAVNKIKKYIS